MRSIVYDIAVTLDGFIAHPDGSFDGFVMAGPHADAYLRRLQTYTTTLMGRKTYEAGYAYGLQPGRRAYPHMDHHIVSRSLSFDAVDGDPPEVQVVRGDIVSAVRELKAAEGGDIYLCGGGKLAGLLLEHQLIDRLIIKRNPVTFGRGIALFGNSKQSASMIWEGQEVYSNGVVCSFFRMAEAL